VPPQERAEGTDTSMAAARADMRAQQARDVAGDQPGLLQRLAGGTEAEADSDAYFTAEEGSEDEFFDLPTDFEAVAHEKRRVTPEEAVDLLTEAGHEPTTLEACFGALKAICGARDLAPPADSAKGVYGVFAALRAAGKAPRDKTRGAAAAAVPAQAAAAPAQFVAPPGYVLVERYGQRVYLKDNGHALPEAAIAQLVAGANGDNARGWHRSDKMRGAPLLAPYLHPSKSDPTLYLLGDNRPNHTDGVMMVEIVKSGRVNDGVHVF